MSVRTWSLVVALGLGVTNQARAEDCGPLLNELTAYASRTNDSVFHPNRYKVVKVKMATNRPDNRYVSYAEGYLKRFELYLPRPTGSVLISQGLSGASSQLFSDRVASIPAPNCSGGFCFPYSQMFNAQAADKLGISIDVGAKVTLSLDSWGGGKVTFTGACTNRVLYGTTPDGTFFTFSFAKEELPGNPA